jgi:GxxExxY protein
MDTKKHENNITRNNTKNKRLLYKELSYIIQGFCFEIRKEYGPGHKETVYVNLLKEYLELKGLKVDKEKPIKIYSTKTSRIVGIYRPDLVVNNSILIEIKASKLTTKRDERQLYYYLKNSVYELGYLINLVHQNEFLLKE